MADPATPQFMTQAEFSRRRGVSKKTVTDWKQKDLLKFNDAGLVDVEASEWELDQRPTVYRGGVAHRPIRAVVKDEPDPREKPASPKPKAAPPPPASPPPTARPSDGDDEEEDYDPDDPDLKTPQAIRRKENFLGLQRKQDYEVKQGRLVDHGAAEKLFFDTARDYRDAWAAWPSRIATIMADELGIDARTLTTVLTAHVQQHLEQLGDPEATLPQP
ncbi:hypothetical protein [Methylobacterium sp.]|uniref:hypothetical protein n=1 Tax=Methylobacterium sp. TaxID=409 RepID=UPI003B012FDB